VPERLVATKPGDAMLSARGLRATRLGPIDLDLRQGEIVGIAGVAGNGQTELLASLAGLMPASGEIRWRGEIVPARDRAPTLRRLGLAHIPEDRTRMGLIGAFAAWESTLLGVHRERARWGYLPVEAIRTATHATMTEWDVRPPDPMQITRAFSGGNQQKLVAAREIGRNPAVLLVGQPTNGVDIGAIETIHRRLVELKAAGAAILLVSVELDEILTLSDRILVMEGGRIAGELSRDEASEERLGLLMAGVG
jgi:simple sugar transport system ATP-binding protein